MFAIITILSVGYFGSDISGSGAFDVTSTGPRIPHPAPPKKRFVPDQSRRWTESRDSGSPIDKGVERSNGNPSGIAMARSFSKLIAPSAIWQKAHGSRASLMSSV
jgi:hypothetical protein